MTNIQSIAMICDPHMKKLCDVTSETVSLVIKLGETRMTVSVMLGHHELIASPKVGSQSPIYAGAAGKVILAYLPSDELTTILKGATVFRETSRLTPDPLKLNQELLKIRSAGYAISSGEAVEGQSAIAAPIFDEGIVIAALNLVVPSVRFISTRVKDFTINVAETAKEINNSIVSTLRQTKT